MTPSNPDAEASLFRRAVVGALTAIAMVSLLGLALIQITQPEVEFWSKIGLALFIGFWGGPVFGFAGAVGWHHWQENKVPAEAAPDTAGLIPEPA